MSSAPLHDAVVVGSGPNGLSAAITLAQAGRSVLVMEAAVTIGGGARSAALTLPGCVHDVCSAIHPLGAGSPFFRTLPLARHGLDWVHPPLPLVHPLDGGAAVAVWRSIDETAAGLGADGPAYRRRLAPLAAGWDRLAPMILGPLRPPRHPLLMARFGLPALRSGAGLAAAWFREAPARALIAGLAAHSILPLESPATAAVALVLGLAAHTVGWPLPRGGTQRLSDALAAHLRSLGGTIVTGSPVTTLDDVPSSRVVLFDLSPGSVARIAGDHLPRAYRDRLLRFRHGPGVYKIDWALDGPIPWSADACRRTAMLHLGGSLPEIAAAEAEVWRGGHPERPFVLLAQPSLFDDSRAPRGRQTAWAYCHVPAGSTVDMTERIERQVERFAPGFRDRVLARSAMTTRDMEIYNPNYVGGDIGGGVADLRQLLARPVASFNPYATPNRRLYICSASTPPGPGVHGMCGVHAARAALRRLR